MEASWRSTSCVCGTTAPAARVLHTIRQRSHSRNTLPPTTAIHRSIARFWWRTWTRRAWPRRAWTRTQRGGWDSNHTPLPHTSSQQGNPRHSTPEEYPLPVGVGGGHGGGRGVRSAPNPYKKWNNWNACYSCGFDVPGWHTSKTFPQYKDGHQEAYERGNSQQYIDAGHTPTRVVGHKKFLPLPGTQWGE